MAGGTYKVQIKLYGALLVSSKHDTHC